MTKTIPYRIYKAGFTEFPASNYNAENKTIDVELPEHKKPRWPKEWDTRRPFYGMYTPNGCDVRTYGSGLSEIATVSHLNQFGKEIYKSFGPSLTFREDVI